MRVERIQADVLIIGGGTAGCYAARTIARSSNASIVVCEKAHIKRSGCLAAGVNAINAYITKGSTPEEYVDYAAWDAKGIVREDLLLTMAEGVNRVTKELETLGLVLLKDEAGEYVTRGKRNIKINGENIKPILAKSLEPYPNIHIYNKTTVIDYVVHENQIFGAIAMSVEEEILYAIEAKKVICATGGASGLYGPNHKGASRHKMWYPPFLSGCGYALGIEAGAEMTTFEMRFIALRCKDTIAPTGTLAQGTGAKQVNGKGVCYEEKYGLRTCERVYGTWNETQQGRGPCYLKTSGSSKEQVEELYHAYLNMAPSQTLRWIDTGETPDQFDTEIEGTEPYIVGGHTASGYWVDTNRRTTIQGLYAVGDVAGGCPQKYVTGALVEGEIAAKSILEEFAQDALQSNDPYDQTLFDSYIEKHRTQQYNHLNQVDSLFTVDELEEAMQTIMDTYAGGIPSGYQYNEESLARARQRLLKLQLQLPKLRAQSVDDLVRIYELNERFTVCFTLLAHLSERKETRWHCFAAHMDYPMESEQFLHYVNSRKIDGSIHMIHRPIVRRGERYEHSSAT